MASKPPSPPRGRASTRSAQLSMLALRPCPRSCKGALVCDPRLRRWRCIPATATPQSSMVSTAQPEQQQQHDAAASTPSNSGRQLLSIAPMCAAGAGGTPSTARCGCPQRHPASAITPPPPPPTRAGWTGPTCTIARWRGSSRAAPGCGPKWWWTRRCSTRRTSTSSCGSRPSSAPSCSSSGAATPRRWARRRARWPSTATTKSTSTAAAPGTYNDEPFAEAARCARVWPLALPVPTAACSRRALLAACDCAATAWRAPGALARR